MMRAMFFLVLIALPLATGQEPKNKTEPQWHPLALAVGKPNPSTEELGLREVPEGVRLTALVHLPMRFIVGIDPNQSALEAFSDDKETDLLKSAEVRMGFNNVSASDLPSTGKFMKVIFTAPGYPAKNATRIRLKAKVAIMVGKEEKAIEKKDVSLKKGADLEIGTFKIVDRIFGNNSSVNYKGNRPLKQVVFLDPNGEEIPNRRNTSSLAARNAAKGEFSNYFYFNKGKLDRCSISVTYFESIEKIIVPIELDIGLGL